jgi:hypothetical protein
MKSPLFTQFLAMMILLGGLLATIPVHATADAPRVSVVFVEPDKFTDLRYWKRKGARAHCCFSCSVLS